MREHHRYHHRTVNSSISEINSNILAYLTSFEAMRSNWIQIQIIKYLNHFIQMINNNDNY